MKHQSTHRRAHLGASLVCLRNRSAVFLLASLLFGCGGPEPKPPEPRVNPHPHQFTKLKISVEPGSGVTGVRVQSAWIVGDDSCAPHQPWPSPAPITKQVNVWEKVEKIDTNDYVSTIMNDRFLPDKCKWLNGGYDIRFMRGHSDLSSMATEKRYIEQAGVLKLTCETNILVPPAPPVCLMRGRESFIKAHRYPMFNATVEIKK